MSSKKRSETEYLSEILPELLNGFPVNKMIHQSSLSSLALFPKKVSKLDFQNLKMPLTDLPGNDPVFDLGKLNGWESSKRGNTPNAKVGNGRPPLHPPLNPSHRPKRSHRDGSFTLRNVKTGAFIHYDGLQSDTQGAALLKVLCQDEKGSIVTAAPSVRSASEITSSPTQAARLIQLFDDLYPIEEQGHQLKEQKTEPRVVEIPHESLTNTRKSNFLIPRYKKLVVQPTKNWPALHEPKHKPKRDYECSLNIQPLNLTDEKLAESCIRMNVHQLENVSSSSTRSTANQLNRTKI
jgi:hypothetical protein